MSGFNQITWIQKMPKWSKTKEIKLSSNENVAILRKYKEGSWDKVSPHLIGDDTIRKLKEFEEQEEIEFFYDPEGNRISIIIKEDYLDRLALK